MRLAGHVVCASCGERPKRIGSPCPCGGTELLEQHPAQKPRFGEGIRKELPKINVKNRASRRAATFDACARMAVELPCCACQKRPPSEPAHVDTRGSGGKDTANVVPLCGPFGCHAEQHAKGIDTFQAEHRVDLKFQAARVLNLVRFHACRDYSEQVKAGEHRCKVCLEPVDSEVTP